MADVDKSSVVTWSYDDKGRLTQEDRSGQLTHTYDYNLDSRDNLLYNEEQGATATYDAFGQITTMETSAGIRTLSYDDNGNLSGVLESDGSRVTMSYDKENRLAVHEDASGVTTYQYGGDGLKRLEITSSGTTTLVWDGMDYLGEIS